MLTLSPPIQNESQLRQKVRALWNTRFDPGFALILKTEDRFNTVAALRTFATELGARAIILDIDKTISEEQLELLRRPGPRIVVISGIDTMAPEDAKGIHEQINSGGRAMPVFIWLQEPEVPETGDGDEAAETTEVAETAA